MRVAIASDHTAMELRENVAEFVRAMGHEVVDLGTNDPSRADYPVYGRAVGEAVASGKVDRGIAICGTGIGISIAANKVPSIRCALCGDCFSAKATRLHNNANVLALGALVTGPGLALEIVDIFLDTPFSEEERHSRRVSQLEEE